MKKFIVLENQDKLCPRCGSISRTRRLWTILENIISGKRILHFSPSKSIRSKLESVPEVEYITTDYVGEFDAIKSLNIESIDEPDNHYDIIICYHILEHVENDTIAMQELHRILHPDGLCIIQTPFKNEEIYENKAIITEAERLFHFGQKDHLRIYSPHGLMDRLSQVGFNPKLKEYREEKENRSGYKMEEKVVFALILPSVENGLQKYNKLAIKGFSNRN